MTASPPFDAAGGISGGAGGGGTLTGPGSGTCSGSGEGIPGRSGTGEGTPGGKSGCGVSGGVGGRAGPGSEVDPSKRVTSACEQISSSMSLISSSVVGTHFIIVDTSPGPDAPFRTVAEVHDMARVVLLDLERRLPILPSSNRDDYCSIVRRTQTLKYFVRAPSGLLLAARCVHHLAGNGELSTHQQAPPSATGEALRPKFRAQGLALAWPSTGARGAIPESNITRP